MPFSARAFNPCNSCDSCDEKRQSRSYMGLPPGLWLVCWVVFIGRERVAALVAVAAVRGHRLGDRVDGSDPASGGGVPEGGDLRRFDALGKFVGLRPEGVRTQGVGGCGGLGGADGGVGGVAAREQTGEETGEAQRGYFEEVAFGT